MKTGFIGIGSMGGMLVRAFLRSGGLAPEDVWAANRSQAKLDLLASQFPGIHVASDRQVAAQCDRIFLCLSAADTAVVLARINPELSAGQLLLTTAGAIALKDLEDRVPCRVAKLIPSITQEIGAGIALLIYGSRVTAEDRSLAESLLSRISQPVVITESLARPTIGLTSGGPALFAYLLQCMAEEAAQSNHELSPELARKLVQETAGATMKLLNEANMDTQEAIRRVAAPGGMTALAIEALSRYVPEAWRTMFRETAERANQSALGGETETTPRSPETVAQAFVNAINHQDIDALCRLMSDEHRFIDSLGTVVHGREKMHDGWAFYFRMVPDYTVTVHETFSAGPIVVMLGVAAGTYVRDGQPLPENSWQTPTAWRAWIQDGNVAEWRVYCDNEPIRQLMARSK